jgi:malate dehydrogenase (oxaloacetate-decarboxylating)
VSIRQLGESLLPPISNLRMVSATVAIAVAHAAAEEDVAGRVLEDPVQQVFDAMWQPVYPELILGKRSRSAPRRAPRSLPPG